MQNHKTALRGRQARQSSRLQNESKRGADGLQCKKETRSQKSCTHRHKMESAKRGVIRTKEPRHVFEVVLLQLTNMVKAISEVGFASSNSEACFVGHQMACKPVAKGRTSKEGNLY